MTTKQNTMNIHDILDYLPHRYPFLYIDKVNNIQEGEVIQCVKNVSYNEPYFPGHFQHHPVMPGVLMIEAMAQACGILAFKTLNIKPDNTHVFYLVGVDDVRFRQPVVPGDILNIESRVIATKRTIWKFATKIEVAGKVVCAATLMCSEQSL